MSIYSLLIRTVLACIALAAVQNTCALAQNRAFDCLPSVVKEQTTSKEIIKKVQNVYNGVNSLTGDFEQESFLSSLEVTEGSSGKVWFAKPGRMKFHYTQPDEQIFIVRDSTIWLYQAKEQQVVIDNISDVLLSDLPVSFLMGIGNLDRDFDPGKACHSQEGLVVALSPKRNDDKGSIKKDNGLAAFLLLIDDHSFAPKGAKVTDIGGNVTSIVLKDITLNPAKVGADSQEFEAKFPAGIDIDDRRNQHEEAPKSEE